MQKTKTLPKGLQALTEFFQALPQRVPVPILRKHLEALELTAQDVAEFAVYDDSTYRRNLVFECDMAEVLLICWKSGQRSPIHNHAGSTCGFKVLEGTGVETVFDLTPCGQVVAVKSATMEPGYICAAKDADIHQVSNLQAQGHGLVTLHIYSPPLREMDQFSITGHSVERYRPMTFEFFEGGGI